MLNPEIFRANDIRGIAETDLNSEAAETIGLGFGTMIRRQGIHRITVGADVRTHSPRVKGAFIKGLLATGCHVIDIGTIPTPVSYFSAFNVDTEATAVITASHNPSDYNGVKLGIGKGTIFGQAIQDLLAICQAGEFEQGQGKLEELDVSSMYTAWMRENFAHIAKNPLKVVVDPANATGALFFPQLLEDLGQQVSRLYCEVDGTFPNHHPDPTVPENVEDMKKLVIEQGADLGLGFDGDSDRIGVLDDLGRMVPGDLLTALFAREILKEKPGAPICFEVKSSQALAEVVSAHGGQPIMWKVGHSFLKTKMKELNAPLAGEVSGHMFFADRYFGYDDAFYCALRVIELVQKSGKKLSELVDELPKYVATPELRVECANDTIKREMAEKAVAHFKASGLEVNDLDGVRVMFGDGWGLVRASNTQPVLVTRFEARTPERLEEIKESVFDVLRQFGPVVLGGH